MVAAAPTPTPPLPTTPPAASHPSPAPSTPSSAPPSFSHPTLFSHLPSSPPSHPSPSPPSSALRLSLEAESLLSRVDRQKAKKRRKAAERGAGRAGSYVNIYGPDARASLHLQPPDPLHTPLRLRARDLHQLLGWVAGEDQTVKWVFVKNKVMIVQVVWLVIDGLTRDTWLHWRPQWDRLRAFFTSPPEDGQAAQGGEGEGGEQWPVRLRIPSSLFANDTVMQDYMSYSIKPVKPYPALPSPATPSTPGPPTPPPKRPKLDPAPHPPALYYILTPTQFIDNHYPAVDEPGFLHTCDHHRLPPVERARQVKAALEAGRFCVHTHPWGGAGEEDGGQTVVTPALEEERLAERMDDEAEEGEVKEGEGESTLDRMEEDGDLTLHMAGTPASPPLDGPPLFAIDCEMCYTSLGLELTRLTLIDAGKRVLLDSFVRPSNPITNYNTQYSGITEAMLQDCHTTLEEVRHSLLLLLPSTAVLVGHSLENDLRTARFIHARCIDTAVLFPHPRGPPHKSSLRYLTKKWLNRDIQEGHAGHDSTEDAGAAMDLALEKMKRGLKWGVPVQSSELLTDVVARWQRKVVFIGQGESAKRWAGGAATVMSTMSDEQTIDRTVRAVAGAQQFLVVAHLHSLWSRMEEEGGREREGCEERISDACKHVDGLLSSVLKASQPNTLLMVLSGQGSAALVKAMQKKKAESAESKAEEGADSVQLQEQMQADISAAVSELQDGVAWLAVRQ